MFWIGFIVGMVVLALIAFGYFVFCMKSCDVTWKDFNDMRTLNAEVIINRDCRVEVYDEDTDEKVFKAGFRYPWSDEE